jgi:hypothetical protein
VNVTAGCCSVPLNSARTEHVSSASRAIGLSTLHPDLFRDVISEWIGRALSVAVVVTPRGREVRFNDKNGN